MPKRPICEECGNDGTQGALYITIDAQWDPEQQGYVLRERDDEGGREIDCLNCDHRTPDDNAGFPYGKVVRCED